MGHGWSSGRARTGQGWESGWGKGGAHAHTQACTCTGTTPPPYSTSPSLLTPTPHSDLLNIVVLVGFHAHDLKPLLQRRRVVVCRIRFILLHHLLALFRFANLQNVAGSQRRGYEALIRLGVEKSLFILQNMATRGGGREQRRTYQECRSATRLAFLVRCPLAAVCPCTGSFVSQLRTCLQTITSSFSSPLAWMAPLETRASRERLDIAMGRHCDGQATAREAHAQHPRTGEKHTHERTPHERNTERHVQPAKWQPRWPHACLRPEPLRRQPQAV